MKEVISIALCDCSGTQWDRLVFLFHGIDREIAEQIRREKCPNKEYDVILKEYNPPIETNTVGTQSSSQDTIDDTEHEKPAASLVGQETEPSMFNFCWYYVLMSNFISLCIPLLFVCI